MYREPTLDELAPGKATTDGFGIYVHIPFCLRKCHYCDFNSYAGRRELHADYARTLASQIRRWAGCSWPTVTSIYFGGGNPMVTGASSLADVLAIILDRYEVTGDAEITVEANPETVDVTSLRLLRQAGFNRLSLGLQSVNDRQLAALGRGHTHAESVKALAAGRAAGFGNINIDLICCLPGQTVTTWSAELETAAALGAEHVSAYALSVEAGTALDRQVNGGEVELPTEDTQARILSRTSAVLRRRGYIQYEISNYSHWGYECRHNLLYWHGGNYLGYGAGAHSHWEGRRWWHQPAPAAYIRAIDGGSLGVSGGERLDARQRLGEAVILGLRLNRGVDRQELEGRFGVDLHEEYGEIIGDLTAEHLLSAGRSLRLTPRGRRLASEVMASFLP